MGPLIAREQGRHKACPYGSGWWMVRTLWGARGQALGLPLRDRLVDGDVHVGGARAGTRPAPTGAVEGDVLLARHNVGE